MMPLQVRTCSVWRPTEARRHRRDWRGRFVLQVMDEQDTGFVRYDGQRNWTGKRARWRDAELADMQLGLV